MAATLGGFKTAGAILALLALDGLSNNCVADVITITTSGVTTFADDLFRQQIPALIGQPFTFTSVTNTPHPAAPQIGNFFGANSEFGIASKIVRTTGTTTFSTPVLSYSQQNVAGGDALIWNDTGLFVRSSFPLDLGTQVLSAASPIPNPLEVKGVFTTKVSGPQATDYARFSSFFVHTVDGQPVNQVVGTVSTLTIANKPTPQTVFLDFGTDASARFVGFNQLTKQEIDRTFSKKDSGLNLDERNSVTEIAQDIFSKYLVNFTQIRPTSGPYFTVYVGGTADDLGVDLRNDLVGILKPGVNGFAATNNIRDIGSTKFPKTNAAIVLSADDIFHETCITGGADCFPNFSNNIEQLGQVIAHEVGHLLGLRHIDDTAQLMRDGTPRKFLFGGEFPVDIGGPTALTDYPGKFQDSDGLLSCFVGLRDGNQRDCDNSSIFDYLDIGISASRTIYDARLYFSDDDGSVFDLGTISPGSLGHLQVPFLPQGAFFAGRFNIDGPLEVLGSRIGQDSGGILNVELTEQFKNDVPEPASLTFFLLSGFFVIWLRSRRISQSPSFACAS